VLFGSGADEDADGGWLVELLVEPVLELILELLVELVAVLVDPLDDGAVRLDEILDVAGSDTRIPDTLGSTLVPSTGVRENEGVAVGSSTVSV
jgi:hypothetical protein